MNGDDNEAAGRQAEDPPRLDEWEPFALARDEVIRNRRASETGAAEWLRQGAANGEVRVRYAAKYHALEARGARYAALRGSGPRNEEEARFLAGYVPADPLDELRERPDVMEEH